MTLRLRTFGGFSLAVGSGPQSQQGGQPVRSALLVFLALEREVTRDSALALLWPDSDQDHARQALRQTLHLLRRDLGEDWLEASGDSLCATPELIADAHDLIVAAEADDHERVAELYSGSFLRGVHLAESQPFQLWCDQWGGRVERLHRRSRRTLIEARVAAGDLQGALASARGWLERDSLEDEAHHRVVELLALMGRADEALQEYTRFQALLAQEGLKPLEQTRELVEKIRAEERSLPPLPTASPGESRSQSPGSARPPAGLAGRRFLRPGWRWRLVVPTGAVLGALALLLLLGERHGSPTADPERVMVLPLVNETGDSVLDDVGLLAADWITHLINRMGRLRSVPSADVQQMLGAGMSPEEAAAVRRAGTLVSGRYFRAGDSLELHVRITDLAKRELWDALEPVRITADAPEAGLRELQSRVGGSLGVRFTPESALPDPAALKPPNYPAFQALMEAAAYISRVDWAGALPHLRRAAELDPTFYRAHLALVAAYSNLGQPARADSLLRALASRREQFSPYDRLVYRMHRASLDGDLGQELAVVQEAVRMDPGGTLHYTSAGIALESGRPREAIRLYSTLDPHCMWAPEWLGPWYDWTAAFHLLDNHRRELKEARRARQWHPDRLEMLFVELRALAALGRLDAVREDLARAAEMPPEGSWTPGSVMRRTAAELRVHGHPAAADEVLTNALGWYEARPAEERSRTSHRIAYLDALLMSGRLLRAEEVASELQRAQPESPDLLGREGVLAARLGDSARAGDIASRPHDPPARMTRPPATSDAPAVRILSL